jgi:hypothetical protein
MKCVALPAALLPRLRVMCGRDAALGPGRVQLLELIGETGASDSVGFTFNSKDFTGTNSWPVLTITAAAKPLVWISSIQGLGANQVALRFNTASNWTYVLQGLGRLTVGSPGNWSNLFTVAAKPFDDQALFVDGMTNRQRFYRLVVSP